jgi:hypothetical protein
MACEVPNFVILSKISNKHIVKWQNCFIADFQIISNRAIQPFNLIFIKIYV